MKVVVTIPWRPAPDRERPFAVVWQWYVESQIRPDRIIAVDSGHPEFNRAASRNACVRAAEDADVVIINDADTIPHGPAVAEAILQAADGQLHFGLDRMKYLSEAESERFYSGASVDVSDAREHDSSVLVCQPEAWWKAGGQDERFGSVYGGEDGAFCSAAEALIGVQWHQGTAISLYHDPSVRIIGQPEWRPNSRLAQRYWAMKQRPNEMRRLINERNYPGAVHV